MQSLLLDPNQPLDEAALTTALGQEIVQRIGLQVFGDPNGLDEESPGRIRVFPPVGEIVPNQVRICKVDDLRTAHHVPPISLGDYLPAEIQQDCAIKIVDGLPQVVCQVLTKDHDSGLSCPGRLCQLSRESYTTVAAA